MTKRILISIFIVFSIFRIYGGVTGTIPGPAFTQDYQIRSESEPFTDRNIYLGELVQWHPGPAGVARGGSWVPNDLIPVQNNNAIGGPTGTGAWSSGGGNTYIGINGSATWKFEEEFYVFDGEGDDFRTFQGNFAWGGATDGLCCELGHVEVSEDMVTWYYNSAEKYGVNPSFAVDNGEYRYDNVNGLHGNNPTWANVNQDMDAQEIVDGKWENNGETVSKDFKSTDPYLGGNGFDLSTFRSKTDNTPWPGNGKMRYLRVIDDNTILDGQDYAKGWCLGAHLHAAMAINVKQDE